MLTEEIDNIMHYMSGNKYNNLLEDPFAVDDHLDDLVNNNNFGF